MCGAQAQELNGQLNSQSNIFRLCMAQQVGWRVAGLQLGRMTCAVHYCLVCWPGCCVLHASLCLPCAAPVHPYYSTAMPGAYMQQAVATDKACEAVMCSRELASAVGHALPVCQHNKLLAGWDQLLASSRCGLVMA